MRSVPYPSLTGDVYKRQALEGHVQISGGFIELFPLPCLSRPLGLEAPLLSLLALAVDVYKRQDLFS